MAIHLVLLLVCLLILDKALTNPAYFVRKESEDKMLSMTNMNIERWIEDAPETSQRFANGEFGNYKRKK